MRHQEQQKVSSKYVPVFQVHCVNLANSGHVRPAKNNGRHWLRDPHDFFQQTQLLNGSKGVTSHLDSGFGRWRATHLVEDHIVDSGLLETESQH